MSKSVVSGGVCLWIAAMSQAFAVQDAVKVKGIETIEVRGTRAPLYDARDVNAASLGIKDPLTLPISIQSFSEELIVNQRSRTLAEILSNDASIQNTAIGNVFDFVSLRGFQLDWTNGLRRDGLAVAPFQDVALENIQRIDVLKGPSSLISGFNNPGGSVNYVTKRPSLENFTDITAELRSREGRYLHLDTSGKFGDSELAYRLNAAVEDTGDFTGGDDLERYFISGAIDWQVTDELLIRADMDYQDKSMVSQPLIGLASDPSDSSRKVLPPYLDTSEVLLGQPWALYETEAVNLALRADYRLSENWQWITQIAHAGNDRFTIFPDIYEVNLQGDVIYSDILITPDETYQTLSAHSFLSGGFLTGNVKHDLVAGLSIRDYKSNDGRWFNVENPISNIFKPVYTEKPDYPEYPQATRTNTTESSVFITDKVKLIEHIYATVGIRHIRYQKQQRTPQSEQLTLDDEIFNVPMLALNYTPSDNASVYFSYTEGVGEGGVAVFGSGAINEGESLGAQESEQLEVGIKYRTANATYTIAIFDIEKMLEYHNHFSNYFVQDGVQSHRGLEFNINGEVTNNLSLVASFTAMEAKVNKLEGEGALNGNRPGNVPRLQANAFFDYRLGMVEGLYANLGVIYVGERQQSVRNTLAMPSYTRVDTGFRYELASLDTTLRLRVENMFGKEYWLSAGAKGIDWGVAPGRGRTVVLSASFDF